MRKLGANIFLIATNVCSIKFCSKHSSNTVLCLLRNLMEQTLPVCSSKFHVLYLNKKTCCIKFHDDIMERISIIKQNK